MKKNMKNGKIDPLFYEAFVRIFGKEGSKRLTRSLVNTILGALDLEKIEEIDDIAGEHTVIEGTVECKTPRLDVRITSGKRVVDLEAQRYPTEVAGRSIYYAACTLVEATGKVKGYQNLPQTILITLLDDPPLFPESENYLHLCRWCWSVDGHDVDASDRQLIVLVELDKIRRLYGNLSDEVLGNKLLSWMYLITRGFEEGSEVDKIIESYPDIEDFAELYGLAVDDPKVRRAYWDAKTAVLEHNNRLEYYAKLEEEGFKKGRKKGLEKGRKKGRKKGLEKGRKKGRKEGAELERTRIAQTMRDQGFSEEAIEAIVNSDSEKVE